MTMFETSEGQLSLEWDSSAEDSPARMSQPQARVLACKVLAAAFGSSSSASPLSCGLSGSWSRTWQAALRSGWTLSCADWNGSDMRAYRSRLRQAISAHRTAEGECLLLPTLTASATKGGYNIGGGQNRTGPVRPSLQTLMGGGARWPTLTAKANLLSPSMAKWKGHRALRAMLPTLCSRDAKGIGPEHTQGGQDLPRTLGGNLNADWCRWFMGFPPGWLDVLDASRFGCSETASSRSAPK